MGRQLRRPEAGIRSEETKVLSKDVVSIVKTCGPIYRVVW